MNNSNFPPIGSTSGVRIITRRAARNWATLAPSSTPTSSISTTGKELVNKHLEGIEDETAIKKITAKHEKEAHERAIAFVRNQLLRSRRDNWLYKPLEELIGYTPKF